jgi:hypothetical protein
MKLHHMDNRAKMTSLKALQVNMRLDSVVEMPLPWDQPIARDDISRVLVPYNRHDVLATKQFALISLDAIKFRIELQDMLDGDVSELERHEDRREDPRTATRGRNLLHSREWIARGTQV